MRDIAPLMLDLRIREVSIGFSYSNFKEKYVMCYQNSNITTTIFDTLSFGLNLLGRSDIVC